VDIGGSGTKTLVLDPAGQPLTERLRDETPQPAMPDAILALVVAQAKAHGEFDRVSVGFPGVVNQGRVLTSANLHSQWIGFDLGKTLEQALGKPVRVANDADVQGLGAIAGKGVELVVTLGTGFGSALFVDGRLVPNLEVAHHPFTKKETYEDRLGRAGMKKHGKKSWNKSLETAIATLEHLFNYDHLYIGGGEAKNIRFDLPDNVSLVSNQLGLLGGIALWTTEALGPKA
jgi:polyphosphate glucokinase